MDDDNEDIIWNPDEGYEISDGNPTAEAAAGSSRKTHINRAPSEGDKHLFFYDEGGGGEWSDNSSDVVPLSAARSSSIQIDSQGYFGSENDESEYEDDKRSDPLQSRFNEASFLSIPFTQPSNPHGALQLSQQTSNISVGRFEEGVLADDSHRDVEVERQRKKLERKRKRLAGTQTGSKKKEKYQRSERQQKRFEEDKRFRYLKSLDVSGEDDYGGSFEYLIRQKLNAPDQKQRLMKVANEREIERLRTEKEEREKRSKEEESCWDMLGDSVGDGLSIPSSIDHKVLNQPVNQEASNPSTLNPNWNFLEEGFVTMPVKQAKQLPYYIGNILTSAFWLNDEGRHCTNEDIKTKNGPFSAQTKVHEDIKNEWDDFFNDNRKDETKLAHVFPVHFHRSTEFFMMKSEVRQDEFASEHGKMARQIWIRLVAGGATSLSVQDDHNTISSYCQSITGRREPDIYASDLSSQSSKSSSNFHRRSHNSRTTFASTFLSGNNCGLDELDDYNWKHKQVYRLMSLVHKLPIFLRRNHFYFRISIEFGRLRRLWENELKPFFDAKDEHSTQYCPLTPTELWALKSFLGVDGNIRPGPLWSFDPSIPAEPTTLYLKLKPYRRTLQSRLLRIGLETKKGWDANRKSEITSSITLSKEESLCDTSKNVDGEEEINDNDHQDFNHSNNAKVENLLTYIGNVQLKEQRVNFRIPETSSIMDKIQQESDQRGDDVYAKVVHDSKIDTTIVVVSLSLFLDELAASRLELYHHLQLDESTPKTIRLMSLAQQDVENWHKTIDSYFTQTENQSNFLDVTFFKRGGKSPQCAPLAQSIRYRQSYIANSGGLGFNESCLESSAWQAYMTGEEEQSDSDNLAETEKKNRSAQRESRMIQLAASDIAKRGNEYLTNKKLNMFSDIHMTTGVATIAQHLTPYAAESLSRSCSSESAERITPFDSIGNSLRELDANGDLVTSPVNAAQWPQGKVVDQILVESFEKAAITFRRCIEFELRSVDHWAWYVASLLGVVCVSSGMPLSLYDNETKDPDVGVKREESSHRIERKRPQLVNYAERRSHARRAILDFIDISSEIQDCAMYHHVLSSMLEWKEAIRLMYRPMLDLSNPSHNFDSEVLKIHAFHIYEWARMDSSEISLARVKELFDKNLISRNYMLDVLARAVEREPCNSIHWYRLVNTLGSYAEDRCAVVGIKEHIADLFWWGESRTSEWEEQFFRPPKSATSIVKPEFVAQVSSQIDVDEQQPSQPSTETSCRSDRYPYDSVFVINPEVSKSWIWDSSTAIDEISGNSFYSMVDESRLPGRTSYTKNRQMFLLDSSLSNFQEQMQNYPYCEALCLKILVASHMVGISNGFVQDSIWLLAVKYWKTKLLCFNICLQWLNGCGIDVAECLDNKRRQYHNFALCLDASSAHCLTNDII